MQMNRSDILDPPFNDYNYPTHTVAAQSLQRHHAGSNGSILKSVKNSNIAIDMELYFWLIDRAGLPQDERNQIFNDLNVVVLHREHTQKIENGVYIAQLLKVMRKSLLGVEKAPFQLSPAINNLLQQNMPKSRKYNWDLLAPEIKKFSVKLKKEQLQLIVEADQFQLVELLKRLYDRDQQLLALALKQQFLNAQAKQGKSEERQPEASDVGLPQEVNTRQQNVTQSPEAQLTSGMPSPLLLDSMKVDVLIQQPVNSIEVPQRYVINDSKDQFFEDYESTPVQRRHRKIQSGEFEPVMMPQSSDRELIKILDQNQKGSNKGNLNLGSVPDDIEISSVFQVAPEAKPNPSSRLSDNHASTAQTTLQFIVESLIQSFNINQNSAAALLAHNQEYLIQLCTKGLKGKDYSSILAWFHYLIIQREQLANLIEKESRDPQIAYMTLNILKCGLYSPNADVVQSAFKAFLNLAIEINNKNTSLREKSTLQLALWDWFIHPQNLVQASPFKKKNKSLMAESLTAMRYPVHKKDTHLLQNEPGIKQFIRAYYTHTGEVMESFIPTFSLIGDIFPTDFLLVNVQQQFSSESAFLQFFHDVVPEIVASNKGQKILFASEALHQIMTLCLEKANESTSISPGYAVQERQKALLFIVDIWKLCEDKLKEHIDWNATEDKLLRALNKGCKDNFSFSTKTIAINLLFDVLQWFAQKKNGQAPIIYKELTFILIENFSNTEQRTVMLNKFSDLFASMPNIPPSILCTPLFKQIHLHLQKVVVQEQQQQALLQPFNQQFQLNVVDFEFFEMVSRHPKMTPELAAQMLEIVTLIAKSQIIFTRVSLKILQLLFSLFGSNSYFRQQFEARVTDYMSEIKRQDRQKLQLYQIVAQDTSLTKLALPTHSIYKNEFNMSDSLMMNKLQQSISSLQDKQSSLLNDQKLHRMFSVATQFYDESSLYNHIRANEKMIVNLMQCMIMCGDGECHQFLTSKLAETYVHIEQKFKFKSNALIYLLSLLTSNIDSVISSSRKQLAKHGGKAKHIVVLSSLKDSDSRSDGDQLSVGKNQNAGSALFDQNLRSSKANNSAHMNLESLKARNVGHLPPVSVNLSNHFARRSRSTQLYSNRSVAHHLNQQNTGEFGIKQEPYVHYEDQLETARSNSITKRSQGPQNWYQGKLFDLESASQEEYQFYLRFIQQRIKTIRNIFDAYSSEPVSQASFRTFEQSLKAEKVLNIKDVNKFLQDYNFNKQQLKRHIELKEMIKLINLKLHGNKRQISHLTLECFIELMVQLGYLFEGLQRPLPSHFLPALFQSMKVAALKSQNPTLQRMFSPKWSNKGNLLEIMTENVNLFSDYKLPIGFVKIKKPPAEIIAAQIINELLSDIFGIEVGMKEWAVKPQSMVRRTTKKTDGIPFQKNNTLRFRLQRNQPSSDEEQSLKKERQSELRKIINKSPFKPKPQLPSSVSQKNSYKKPQLFQTPDPEPIHANFQTLYATQSSFDEEEFKNEPTRPMNRIETERLKKQHMENMQKHMQQEQMRRRNLYLKKQLRDQMSKRRERENSNSIREKEIQEDQERKKQARENDKKLFYQQIRSEYERDRLPEIQDKKVRQEEMKRLEEEMKKQRAMDAKTKLTQRNQQIQEQFEKIKKDRADKELKKQNREKSVKKKQQQASQEVLGKMGDYTSPYSLKKVHQP